MEMNSKSLSWGAATNQHSSSLSKVQALNNYYKTTQRLSGDNEEYSDCETFRLQSSPSSPSALRFKWMESSLVKVHILHRCWETGNKIENLKLPCNVDRFCTINLLRIDRF